MTHAVAALRAPSGAISRVRVTQGHCGVWRSRDTVLGGGGEVREGDERVSPATMVWRLGIGVWGLGIGVWGSGFEIWGLRFRVNLWSASKLATSTPVNFAATGSA